MKVIKVLTAALAVMALSGCPSGNMMGTGGGSGTGGSGNAGGGSGNTGGGAGNTGGGSGNTGGGSASGGGSATGGGTATGGGSAGGGSSDGGVVQGEDCATAVTLTAGTQTGLPTGATNDLDDADGDFPGSDRAFTIAVPPGKRLTVKVTPTLAASGAPQYDAALYLVEGPASNCSMMVTTLAVSDDPNAYETAETVTFVNRGTSAKTLFVVVDSFVDTPDADSTGDGTFDIQTTLDDPPGDDICATTGITAVTTSTPVTNQTTAGYALDFDGATSSCLAFASGDRVYSFSVPAGQRARLTVTPPNASNFQPVINVVDGNVAACQAMPLVCLSNGFAAADGDPATARVRNTGASAANYFALIGGASGPDTFDVSLATDSPTANDTCDMSGITLSSTALPAESLAGFVADYGQFSVSGCPAGEGPDRVYKVDVPAGQRFTAVLTPLQVDGGAADGGVGPADLDAVITLIPAPAQTCETGWGTCAASVDEYYGGRVETLSFVNQGASTASYFMVVGSYDPTFTHSDYSLAPSFAAPAAGDVCSNAITAAAGTLSNQTTAGLYRDFKFASAKGCKTTTGRDIVYAVSLPASKTLTVTVTPPTTMATADGGTLADGGLPPSVQNPVINIVEGPVANCTLSPTCVASADMAVEAMPETVSYTNSTTATKQLFVVVSNDASAVDLSATSVTIAIP